MNEIKEILFHYLSSDGSNQTGKYVKMNDGDNPFFYLYYLVFGEKTHFAIKYKTPKDGKLETTVLNADIFKNLECHTVPIKIEKYLELDYKLNNIALLTLKSFSSERLSATNEDFEVFLAKSFKEIKDKKVKNLIIDLRENSGGDDINGALLYSYLTNKPFKYYSSLTSNVHEYTADEHSNLAVQKPNENNYTGKVYFLISGKSFSDAPEFSSVAKSNSRGKLIGEETGGGYYGNTSGSKISFTLPNSKIKVNIPLRKYVMAVKKSDFKDRGIMPDYLIAPTIDEIISNKDVQMNFALKLAQRK